VRSGPWREGGESEGRTIMVRATGRIAVIVSLLLLIAARPAASQTDVTAGVSASVGPIDVSVFYQKLSDDGQWFQSPTYGWSWTPYDMTADWRPYSNGHWEYTDDGWSWASDEPWGWACYHYGRWYFDDTYGWAWVPGTEWAPAWVAWRNTDDYVGWAPLPPGAGWDVSAGLSFGDANAIPWDEWCFVPQRHVFDANLSVQLAPVALNVSLFQGSHDATRYEVRSGHPADLGFDVTRVEASIGHRVPRVHVADVDDPARGNGQVTGDGRAGFYRPRVQGSTAAKAPPPELMNRGQAIPDADLQRMRDQHQKQFESDLGAQRSRMIAEQQKRAQAPPAGQAPDVIKRQQAAEQNAFDQHAARQRQVFQQRMQNRVVRPGNAGGNGRPANPGNGNGKGNGNGADRGKGQDKSGH
jgi:hypothetical protein